MTAHPLSGEWRPFHRSRISLRRRRTHRIPTRALPDGARIYCKKSGSLVHWMAWRSNPHHATTYDVCGWAITFGGAFRKARRALQILPEGTRHFEWNPNDLRAIR